MGDRLRIAVGILGNAASLLLYTAPILTFLRIIKRKKTEGFSCLPYILALFNCLLYTWYGMPIVSRRWENFPIITVNGLGLFLEFSFICTYFWFADAKGKVKVVKTLLVVITVFCATALISAFLFHDHHHRKLVVGSVGLVACVSMYASPLVVVKQVIRTKSVEYMPFYLSFFSFIASSLWMVYGLLSHDLLLASPNLIGCPLGIVQLALYCKYRQGGITEEPVKSDAKTDEDKSQQRQLVISSDANEKC